MASMWVKLIRPVGIHAGTYVSVGPLKAQKLIAEGRAVQAVFSASGDPDNVEEKREKYRKANGGKPLWDQRKRPVAGGSTAADDCEEVQLRRAANAGGFDPSFVIGIRRSIARQQSEPEEEFAGWPASGPSCPLVPLCPLPPGPPYKSMIGL